MGKITVNKQVIDYLCEKAKVPLEDVIKKFEKW